MTAPVLAERLGLLTATTGSDALVSWTCWRATATAPG